MTTTDTARPTREQALAAVDSLEAAAFVRGDNLQVAGVDLDIVLERAKRQLIALIEALTPEPDQHAGAAEKIVADIICKPGTTPRYRAQEVVQDLTASGHLARAEPAADQVVISRETADQARQAMGLAGAVLTHMISGEKEPSMFWPMFRAEQELDAVLAIAAADRGDE